MTDVFDQNAQTTPDGNAPVQAPLFNDKLKTIVDESGRPKYDNVEKALDALAASQAHIKQLETEAAARKAEQEALRDKAAQADALEEIVKRLQQNNNPTQRETTTPNAGMSEQATIEALEKILNKRDAEKAATDNMQAVQNKLVAKFGDLEKTKAAVAAKAQELGLTTQELGALSSKSPKAVLAYFGVDTPVGTSSPVTPSQSTPITTSSEEPLKRPEKSLLLGATSKEQKDFMKQVKESVYKRHGIQT